MTLIAFATYSRDRAEFITDTGWYTSRVSHLGHCAKHVLLPHIDAAVVAGGDHEFNVKAKTTLLWASSDLPTFDDLADYAPDLLRELWAANAAHRDATTATVFLLGWSAAAGKFVARGYAADRDFEPFSIPGLWVMPTPWSMRPSRLEAERIAQEERDDPTTLEAIEIWKRRDPTPAPRTRQEWVDLAITARQERSLQTTTARVIVAGDVFHTVIKRGSAHTERIHRFDDGGDEFQWMLRGTEHPLAQTLECGCGSGRVYGECCALIE